MPEPLTDPHPNPQRFVGKLCRFIHGGKRRRGIVTAQEFIGYSEVGHIPDYKLTIRGEQTGHTMEIKMWESWATVDT